VFLEGCGKRLIFQVALIAEDTQPQKWVGGLL
jgi:hypothetical protein